MRIALVAPLFESVPPKMYGGTERVVSYLSEELVHEGHDVTLFASGDSVTAARLISTSRRALRLGGCVDSLAAHILMLGRVAAMASEFDVIHFHTDYLHFPLSRLHCLTHVTTLHGRLDLPQLPPLYNEYRDVPLVSISGSQRAPLAFANWVATVHHGLPDSLYTFRPERGRYLAFLGRVAPEKRVDRAIEIARRVDMELWIAAKVDRADEAYYESIRPLLRDPRVHYLGEIGEQEKDKFLGEAYALLFPIDWPEPFGLVMIEAMACGTPVIAFPRGSVPELMSNGETGFVVNDVDEAVAALARLETFNRRRCRRVFENRFTAQRMGQNYLAVYRRLITAKERSCRVA